SSALRGARLHACVLYAAGARGDLRGGGADVRRTVSAADRAPLEHHARLRDQERSHRDWTGVGRLGSIHGSGWLHQGAGTGRREFPTSQLPTPNELPSSNSQNLQVKKANGAISKLTLPFLSWEVLGVGAWEFIGRWELRS